jgi:hypothetical protein
MLEPTVIEITAGLQGRSDTKKDRFGSLTK